MKYIITFGFVITIGTMSLAQTMGKILYTETQKLDIQVEGIDESIAAMLPKTRSVNKDLIFNSNESLYLTADESESEDTELSSDDGSVRIMFQSDDDVSQLYKSFESQKAINQRGLFGKTFIVEEPLDKKKWKITNEKIKYLGYECQKAVIEEEDKFIVAWFTSQIPVKIGPEYYDGLPGAILLISKNDGELEIKAQKVKLDESLAHDIKIPDGGKKVSNEEFESIREEKEKEMEKMYRRRTIRRN